MSRYYFNLPPITDLTISQQAALNEIGPIAINGGPGTGKSVVALWRHINNHRNSQKSLLLTYTTTLAYYLRACGANYSPSAAENTSSALRARHNSLIYRNFDELIIDEGQDLGADYYNDININTQVSYGADDSQILYPDKCSTEENLRERYPKNTGYTLDKNFRNTYYIMKFAKECFLEAIIPQKLLDDLYKRNRGEKPVFLVAGPNKYDEEARRYVSSRKQNSAIVDIINGIRNDTSNIAILVPFKNTVDEFKDILQNNGINDFSYYHSDGDERGYGNTGCSDLQNLHITTFKSSKGLEFDTVIIPNFRNYINLAKRNNSNFAPAPSFNLSWKDLYVACTRAKSNLYLISDLMMSDLSSVVDLSIL